MNKKNQKTKYLVLKISDINKELSGVNKEDFWYYVRVIRGNKT